VPQRKHSRGATGAIEEPQSSYIGATEEPQKSHRDRGEEPQRTHRRVTEKPPGAQGSNRGIQRIRRRPAEAAAVEQLDPQRSRIAAT
jgi:hypothetical protein